MSVHARDLQMKFPQIWTFSFQTKSQSSNSFSFRQERFWTCAGHMSPSLFCATTMATVYREVYVTHDGPSLRHFQPSHHDFSCMEAAAEAAACISGSWERAAVKVQAVYWWSVKRTRQKRRTRTRKTGKNKPRGLQSRQWSERSWAGYVWIGPLCKQRRFFPLCGVILSEQFSSSSSSFWGRTATTSTSPQHLRPICAEPRTKAIAQLSQPSAWAWARTSGLFSQGSKAKQSRWKHRKANICLRHIHHLYQPVRSWLTSAFRKYEPGS